MSIRTVTIAVVGVSGKENVKGRQGVGKSLLCNRFVRGDFDDFIPEHSSVLSQTDFSGSPVVNNDHWLYWGDRCIDIEDGGDTINLRVVEQTEFLDDETYEPLAGPSTLESYPKRAARTKLESKDKLMYLQKEQLGLEVEFPQQVLPDGKCQVDGFLYVFDASHVPGRNFESQVTSSLAILGNIVKTKKPLVLAISKCDIWDEEWRKAVQQLVSGKILKGMACPVIETSSFMNVNIEDAFTCTATLAMKGKFKSKVSCFGEAAKIIAERKNDIRQSFIRLLQGIVPIDSWPAQRLSYSSLRLKLGIDRHKDFIAFIRCFGAAAAKKLYDQHVNEAREHWMGARLKALFPKLPHVFAALLDSHDVPNTTWADARRIIHAHAFFEEYFQPLGTLGKQLDPLSPDTLYEDKRVDPRIPAEILMRSEARDYYEAYKTSIESEQRQERLEEDFEFLLAETTQVTPGRTLQDVSIFLQGCEPYEALAPNQAAIVYDRFQTDLVQRAEHDFNECLLEHTELFLEIIQNHKSDSLKHKGVYHSDRDMAFLKDLLQEDHRYRQLTRLFELRDNMIHQFASFIANPMISRCYAKQRCADVVVSEASLLFLQRRKMSEPCVSSVDLAVHGDISTVAQFITELNVMLRNDVFHSSNGPAVIRCYGADEYSSFEENQQPRTQLFLIDSHVALEKARNYVGAEGAMEPPPVFVLICDPSHFDLLPQLHHQGTALADSTGGVFIGAGTGTSDDGHWSRNSDCSSIFGKDQLARVCEAACNSSINPFKCDLRVNVSVMCGDTYPVETFLGALLSPNGAIEPAVKYNDILGGGIIPLSLSLPSGNRCRIDLSISSYHNWAFAQNVIARNGHILLFSAKRPASLAHAKAAIARILDRGSHSVSGKSIFLIAVVDQADRYDNECSNLLLTEGSELATSIGASFTVLHTEEPNHPASSATFLNYFSRLMHIAPQYPSSSISQRKRDSDGYATLTEFHNLNIHHTTPFTKIPSEITAESLSSDSTVSTGRLHSAKKIDTSNMRTSMSAGSMNASVSSVHRPRRRIAPAVPPVRIPAIRPPVMAPLATPEAVDVAPDYSLVQDALTDDDHIYATLDFEKEYGDPASEDSYTGDDSPKKEKKRALNARMFSVQSSNTGNNNPARGDGKKLSSPTAPVMMLSADSHRTPALLRSSLFRPTQTQPLPAAPSPRLSSARASTTDIVKHRRPMLIQPMERAAGGMRHSLSAESIVDLLRGKKKRAKDYGASKFVRKMATSFRMKKQHGDKAEEHEEDPSRLGVSAPEAGSRSLPQSPRMERRATKKLSNANGEKPSAFSWLPSRSPRRQPKSSLENNHGVISPTDTLESLCKAGGGVPLFLTRCVEFIEKDGLQMEGLYRVPGNQSLILELEKNFREKGDVDLDHLEVPVHVVATALKNFFARIPDPIIPVLFQKRIIDQLDSENIEEELRNICSEFDNNSLVVLRYITDHLHRVAKSPSTDMGIKNLSKVWFPTFFRPNFTSFEEMSSGMVNYERAMEALLTHSTCIFFPN